MIFILITMAGKREDEKRLYEIFKPTLKVTSEVEKLRTYVERHGLYSIIKNLAKNPKKQWNEDKLNDSQLEKLRILRRLKIVNYFPDKNVEEGMQRYYWFFTPEETNLSPLEITYEYINPRRKVIQEVLDTLNKEKREVSNELLRSRLEIINGRILSLGDLTDEQIEDLKSITATVYIMGITGVNEETGKVVKPSNLYSHFIYMLKQSGILQNNQSGERVVYVPPVPPKPRTGENIRKELEKFEKSMLGSKVRPVTKVEKTFPGEREKKVHIRKVFRKESELESLLKQLGVYARDIDELVSLYTSLFELADGEITPKDTMRIYGGSLKHIIELLDKMAEYKLSEKSGDVYTLNPWEKIEESRPKRVVRTPRKIRRRPKARKPRIQKTEVRKRPPPEKKRRFKSKDKVPSLLKKLGVPEKKVDKFAKIYTVVYERFGDGANIRSIIDVYGGPIGWTEELLNEMVDYKLLKKSGDVYTPTTLKEIKKNLPRERSPEAKLLEKMIPGLKRRKRASEIIKTQMSEIKTKKKSD
jgi:hypothetical protein